MPAPVVSIVLPTYNRLAYLREAVGSVRAQGETRWELIVVDDGSTDGTIAWLEQLKDERIRVVHMPHSGFVSRLRNEGARRATSTWLAMMDSDDAWHPDKLARQLAWHAEHPDVRWSYTNRTMMDADGQTIDGDRFHPWQPYEGNILEAVLEMRANIALPSVMIARSAYDVVGGFNETHPFGTDSGLWLALAEKYPVGVLAEPLVRIRSHRSSTWGTPDVNIGLAAGYERFANRTANDRFRALALRRQAIHLVAAAECLATSDRRGVRALLADAWHAQPRAPFVYRAMLRLALRTMRRQESH